MTAEKLTPKEQEILLTEARKALETIVKGERLEPLILNDYSDTLKEQGASFVTLTINGQLRGCIGALEPYQPLIEDVREHAIAAATQDYRFSPVNPKEISMIEIEISRLTKPQPVVYDHPLDIISKIRPGLDGVVLKDGIRRATFLPQVWEKIKEPDEFLNHLCLKMGLPANTWRNKKIEVFTYQVEEFHE